MRAGERSLLCIGLAGLVGALIGLVRAWIVLSAQQYLSQGMWRLAWSELSGQLDVAMGMAAVLSAGVFLAARSTAWNSSPSEGQRGLRFSTLAGCGLAVLLFYSASAWLVQSEGLELLLGVLTPALLVDAVLLAGASIAVWWLAGVDWKSALKTRWMGRAGRAGLVFLLLWLLLDVGLWSGLFRARSQGPNLIVIVVDTLRASHLGIYGYQRDTSPTIDALARDSVIFRSAVAHAPWTAPSVGSLLTSRSPAELGFGAATLPVRTSDEFLFMAEIFQEHGYRTQAIVSHTYVSTELGFGQGFQGFDSENALGHDHVSSESVTEKAIAFLNSAGDQPFFLLLHYFDPHFSYILQKPYEYFPDYPGPLESGMDYEALMRYVPLMGEADIEYVKALYDSEIRYTDAYLGLLLDELKRLGLYDRSVLVFTADHGETFVEREDRWLGHGKTLFEELVHVPLLVKLEGNEGKGLVVEQPVGLEDFLPTIVDYLALPPPRNAQFEGRVLPLRDPESLLRLEPRPIFSETRAQKEWVQSVRWGNWKLILDRKLARAYLFDLSTDPGETRSLTVEQPEVLARLALRLNQWAQEIDRKSRDIEVALPEFSPEQLDRLRSLGYVK